MKQKINIEDSQKVVIIQAGGNVYIGDEGLLEARELLPKEVESKLKDGDERNFCFLSIDVVGHSNLSSRFSPESINNTLMKLREWLNSIVSEKNGKELNWAGDGGIFYFLQEKVSDKVVDNAVSSSMDILNGLAHFNDSHNQLYLEGKRTDIGLRLGIDFGRAIYHTNAGNWHSEALNTAVKIQGLAQPNSALITHNVYKDLTDTLRVRLKEDFHLRKSSIKIKDQELYIFSRERIIDPVYEDYFMTIAKLRQGEFEHLGKWVDLYAIETKLVSLQEQERRTIKATELINECVNLGKNAIIFGESGSGKTFTCLKLFEKIEEQYCSQEADIDEKIPVFVELSQVRNNSLEKVMRGSLNEGTFERDKGKYIIFLDGLNEVGPAEEQKRVLSDIRKFGKLNSGTRLFITTQTITEYHQKSGFELYEIKPFRKGDITEYLCKHEDKFKSHKEAESFYEKLPLLIREFISTPVFLYFVVTTYRKDTPVEISNPGELISQYEEFLCGVRESRPLDMDEDYRRRLIPFIAFNMCKDNEINIPLKRFNEYIQRYNNDNHSSFNERETKDIIINRFRLMKVNEKGEFRFILQTLRDYFAGVYMRENQFSPEEILKLVYTDSVKNNDIVNAVRLFAGIVQSEVSKGIVQKFIEKDLYLACEIFAWSSITDYEEEFIDLMRDKIDINSREYLLNLNEVVSFYLKVLDLLQKVERLDEPTFADYMQSLGVAYGEKLDYDRAIESYNKAIEIYEKNQMETHPFYALSHVNLGGTYWNKLDYDRAIELYNKAIEIYEKNEMEGHPYYARCHMNLGIAYDDKLDYDKAIESYNKAIEIYKKNQMETHPDYALCHMNLGIAYDDKLDYDKAIESYNKAIEIYEKNRMESHPSYALCHVNLGITYGEKLDYDRAIESYNKAIEIYEKNRMESHPSYARCHMNLGIAYGGKVDYDQEIELYKKAIDVYKKNKMENHPSYALCHMNLGIAYWSKLDYDKAIEYYNKAIEIYKKNKMEGHPYYARCHMNLGLAYQSIGKKDEAIQSLELALKILEKSVGKNHPDYQLCLKYLNKVRSGN